MRVDEVPRERRELLGRQTKLVYASDAQGRLRAVSSGGEEAEAQVLEEAIDWYAARAAQAQERLQRGEASVLEYLMHRQRMDVATLAQAAGLWRWRVRRHLHPARLARLAPRLRARYAEALGVDAAELGDALP